MKQVKVFFQQGMKMVEKISAIEEIKNLGAERIEFNFGKYPDSALCVLGNNVVVSELENLPKVVRVEKIG